MKKKVPWVKITIHYRHLELFKGFHATDWEVWERSHRKLAEITFNCPSGYELSVAHWSCFPTASNTRMLVNFITVPHNLPSTMATPVIWISLRVLHVWELRVLKCLLCLLLLCLPPLRLLFPLSLSFFTRVLISQQPFIWLKCLPALSRAGGRFSTCRASRIEAITEQRLKCSCCN